MTSLALMAAAVEQRHLPRHRHRALRRVRQAVTLALLAQELATPHPCCSKVFKGPRQQEAQIPWPG